MPVRQKNTWRQGLLQTSSCCHGAELARCSDLIWRGSRALWRYHLPGGKCKNNHVFGRVFELRETAAKKMGDEMFSVEIRQEKSAFSWKAYLKQRS